MKKTILFVYNEMIIGGSTTSLLALLKNIDYNKYEVDLLLYYHRGELLDKVPEQVTLLPEAALSCSSSKALKVVRPLADGSLIKALYHGVRWERRLKFNGQSLAYVRLSNARVLTKHYDVAIGFMEGWPNCQVAFKVQAKKKLIWIHPDCKESGMFPSIDHKTFDRVDNIILVSSTNRNTFNHLFPSYSHKSATFKNLVSADALHTLAQESVSDICIDQTKLNLISVCRIDFKSKGLDRAINALSKLKKEGYLHNLHWYIIGDGDDRESLESMIKTNVLEQFVTLLGPKKNPFPYVIMMDLFFLPSRYEGEPMAVTEAILLDVPVMVTAYASASQQVADTVNGMVIENSDEGIYKALRQVASNPNNIHKLKQKMLTISKDANNSIREFYHLIGS